METWTEFPVVNDLLNAVPAPKYDFRPVQDGSLTEDGLLRAKYHANSASVKQIPPITWLIRGNTDNFLKFARGTVTDQYHQGHYSQPQYIDAPWPKYLSGFNPPDRDTTLIHAGEEGVVMSSYIHTVYPVTRLGRYSKMRIGNQSYRMGNILTLPEDTVSFKAKLRYVHKSSNGNIKHPGEFRIMSLRSDLKLAAWVPLDVSRSMDAGNRRLQVLLPIEYKRHNTFIKDDLDSSTLSHTDPRVPAAVRDYVAYGHLFAGFASPPPPPSPANVWTQPPAVARVPVLVGLGQGEQFEDDEANDPVDQDVLDGLQYHRGHDQVMRDQEVVKPDANIPPPKAVITSNVRQMSAYSASDVTRWAALMNGDVQIMAEFAMMVQQSTAPEQWDAGVGDYAVLGDVWDSGHWMAGLFGQVVWCWLWYVTRL